MDLCPIYVNNYKFLMLRFGLQGSVSYLELCLTLEGLSRKLLVGSLTVKNRLLHLRKYLGINASNYFMYQWAGPLRSPGGLYAEPHLPSLLKFMQFLHLNQASIKDLICYGDKTD